MSAPSPPKRVAVVIGTGGMGLAVARRIGSGRRLFLADYSDKALEAATKILRGEGHNVEGHTVDVGDYASVQKLAQHVAAAGHLEAIVHTAGVSPVQASAKQIFTVDLLGTANIIEAFEAVASAGTSLVCISSMAGYAGTFSADLEQHLAISPLAQLLQHKEIDVEGTSVQAYILAKRGNQLRVQAASPAWGSRGARLNTISPGVISTAMGSQELEGPAGIHIQRIIDISAAGRMGTPDEIVGAVAFLTGPESSFITGNDLLVDGGAVAAQRWIAPLMAMKAQQG